MKKFMQQAAGYTFVSGIALMMDVLLLVMFVELLHWHYMIGACVSFLAGSITSYALVTRFVFDYRRINNTQKEFALFVGVGLGGLAINGLTIHAIVEYLGAGYLVGKAVAASMTFIVNFAIRRWLLFTRWSPTSSPQLES